MTASTILAAILLTNICTATTALCITNAITDDAVRVLPIGGMCRNVPLVPPNARWEKRT